MVNIAVSFFTATKRFATVLRSGDIFSRRSPRLPAGAAATTGALALGASGFLPASALTASSLVIRPSTPVPFTALASIPFSARILPAAGEGVPVA